MRLWSLNPKYLDRIGLVALWREALLAKKVLAGKTKGYKNHPQLERFKKNKQINNYLFSIFQEAENRGYKFNKKKIGVINGLNNKIKINSEQIVYEFNHLLRKLKIRDESIYNKFKKVKDIELNPVFKKVKGQIESWEKIK